MKTASVLLMVFAILAVAVGVILIFGAASNPAMVTGQITNAPAQNSTSTTTPITSVPPSTSQGDTYNVAIQSFAFSPQTMTIDAGDSIRWTNMDSVGHNIISDSGNMIESPILSQGQSYTQLFTTPGTYTYHCAIHPMMKGTIIVK